MVGRSPARSTERVLLVDDEPAVCEALSGSLAARGLDPVCVRSDRDALSALRGPGPRFACLVVDVNLGPGVTGYDVARYARRIDEDLPVVYVSGQTTRQTFEENRVEGDTAFLEKPFSPGDLVAAIQTLISRPG